MNWEGLLDQVRDLVRSARKAAAQSVNTIQVITCFEIGHLIVEHEQSGERRAEYGRQVLNHLSQALTMEFGLGFSERNLRNMRRFFLEYRNRVRETRNETIGELTEYKHKKSMEVTSVSPGKVIWQKASAKSASLFCLSWSHYVFLMAIKNSDERQFYEIEAEQNSWSLPELKRQFNSGLYERLALSRNKRKVQELSEKGQIIEKPEDMIKQPYVLEFLGIDVLSAYSESDLEKAIIDKLKLFLLELGKGFLFESRQKRFTFDTDHFIVDLVFYNRMLRCYVLIDLKIGKLTHQDLGQMQMYVNYFDCHVKTEDENPTVGILLCKMKNDALVELTLPRNAKIFASQYQLYLPSKQELREHLLEWSAGWKEQNKPKSRPPNPHKEKGGPK